MKKKYLNLLALPLVALMLTSCGEMVDPGEVHLIRNANGDTSVHERGRTTAWGRSKRYVLQTAPKTFPMDLQVIAGQDNVNMGITLNWMGQFDATLQEGQNADEQRRQIESIIATASSAGDSVIGGTISLENYWQHVLKSFAEEEAKQVFSAIEPSDMNAQRKELAESVEQAIAARFKEAGFPVRTIGVNLTNLDFPDVITDQRELIAKVRLQDAENAAQAEADVAAAGRLAEVMAKEGEARLVEAEKEAAYFTTLADALTPDVLVLRKLEAAEKISDNMLKAAEAAAQSDSATILITPFGSGDMFGNAGEGDLLLREGLQKQVSVK